MKNPNAYKKSWSLLKAAIFGGLLFAGLSLTTMIGKHFWGYGASGNFGPDFFGSLEMFVGTPAAIIASGTEIDKWFLHFHSTTSSYLFTCLFIIAVNGLLGAALFAVFRIFRPLTMRQTGDETKN